MRPILYHAWGCLFLPSSSHIWLLLGYKTKTECPETLSQIHHKCKISFPEISTQSPWQEYSLTHANSIMSQWSSHCLSFYRTLKWVQKPLTYVTEPFTNINIKLKLFIPPCGCEAPTFGCEAPTKPQLNIQGVFTKTRNAMRVPTKILTCLTQRLMWEYLLEATKHQQIELTIIS
jgi:hypothetical protein